MNYFQRSVIPYLTCTYIIVLGTSEYKREFLCSYTEINKKLEGHRRLWEVLDMCVNLIVVMVPWKFAYLQTHQWYDCTTYEYIHTQIYFTFPVHISKQIHRSQSSNLGLTFHTQSVFNMISSTSRIWSIFACYSFLFPEFQTKLPKEYTM